MSLTDKTALSATEELTVKIKVSIPSTLLLYLNFDFYLLPLKADKENNALHITDTGIGKSLSFTFLIDSHFVYF